VGFPPAHARDLLRSLAGFLDDLLSVPGMQESVDI